MTDRIIALIDMDCFYVQVEQRLNGQLIGRPCAVVQYNAFRGGGLIAVSYEARARGVKRHTRGYDARRACPEVELIRVPELNGKADLTKYRSAGHEVIQVLNSFAKCVERASVDEAYIDLTGEVNDWLLAVADRKVTSMDLQSTFVVGMDATDESVHRNVVQTWLDNVYNESEANPSATSDLKLAVGALLVEQIRAAVLSKTQFKCSAGIAHNKALAKLACGVHKPNRQTILPQTAVPNLFTDLPLKRVRNLGGKLGDVLMEKLGCVTMNDVSRLSESDLIKQFGDKTGNWLFALARGYDDELVTARSLPKSIGCSKNFPGRSALSTTNDVRYWLRKFATELEERLVRDRATNNRVATLLSVSARLDTDSYVAPSRSCSLPSYDVDRIVESAYAAVAKLNTAASDKCDAWEPRILSLGVCASKFRDSDSKSASCMENFLRSSSRKSGPGSDATAGDGTSRSDGAEANDGARSTVGMEMDCSDYEGTTDEDADDANAYSNRRTFGTEPVAQSEPSEEPSAVGTGTGQDCRLGFFASMAWKTTTAPATLACETKAASVVSPRSRAASVLSACPAAYVIDSDVMNSLPSDIQDEIRASMRAGFAGQTDSKAAKAASAKRGIAKFFHERGTTVAGRATSPTCEDRTDADEVSSPADRSRRLPSVSEDEVFCERCRKAVIVWEWLEHQDYHFARDLAGELSGGVGHSAAKGAAAVESRRQRKSPKKNKRSLKNTKQSAVSDKKARSIASYFE